MKTSLTLLFTALCITIASTAFAQDYKKWIVVFKDKNNSPYSFNQPEEFLSQRCIDRRTRYKLKPDSSDLPVNPDYIEQVLAKGNIEYLSQSKWLNQILVFCRKETTMTNKVAGLPFVSKVFAVGDDLFAARKPSSFKEKTAPAKLKNANKIEANRFDYGNSYDQVHIHNGEFLHNKGFDGKGMVIAMLDAGFYGYQTTIAFDSARARGQFLGEKDFVDFDGTVNEDDSHGSNCLSIIASEVPGQMTGTAPLANFWLLRSETTSSEFPVEEHNWAAAAEFADSAGADMISSSLGYYVFDDPVFDHTYNEFYKNSTIVSRAAAYAAKKGMIVTNSAGNEGDGGWKYIIFPADCDSVCSVGATDKDGNLASFSSRGYNGKLKPNIVSVGATTAIYAFYGLSYGDGTSYSNPNINGLIACLWQAFPEMNNMDILKAVYKSSDRYDTPDNKYGYGEPDMKKAYRKLMKKRNENKYGNDWLFVTEKKNNLLAVKLIGRKDGNATLNLVNEDGEIQSTIQLITEEEEVYDASFVLQDNPAAGKYFVQYNDGIQSKTIYALTVEGAAEHWLKVSPVPFSNHVNIHFTATENAVASIRLLDSKGKMLFQKNLLVEKGKSYQTVFDNTASLIKGQYYIEYRSNALHKTVTITK